MYKTKKSQKQYLSNKCKNGNPSFPPLIFRLPNLQIAIIFARSEH